MKLEEAIQLADQLAESPLMVACLMSVCSDCCVWVVCICIIATNDRWYSEQVAITEGDSADSVHWKLDVVWPSAEPAELLKYKDGMQHSAWELMTCAQLAQETRRIMERMRNDIGPSR